MAGPALPVARPQPARSPQRALGDAGESVVVPEGGSFRGLIAFEGEARIDGALEGEVVARGRLTLGGLARVRARIQVDELIVEGELQGEIEARRRAELRPGARVRGVLRAGRLALAEGSRVEGRWEIGEGP